MAYRSAGNWSLEAYFATLEHLTTLDQHSGALWSTLEHSGALWSTPLARSDFRFKKFEQKKHEQIHIVHPIRN